MPAKADANAYEISVLKNRAGRFRIIRLPSWYEPVCGKARLKPRLYFNFMGTSPVPGIFQLKVDRR
jgi:hypothetical protein